MFNMLRYFSHSLVLYYMLAQSSIRFSKTEKIVGDKPSLSFRSASSGLKENVLDVILFKVLTL